MTPLDVDLFRSPHQSGAAVSVLKTTGMLHTCTLDSWGNRFFHDWSGNGPRLRVMDEMPGPFIPKCVAWGTKSSLPADHGRTRAATTAGAAHCSRKRPRITLVMAEGPCRGTVIDQRSLRPTILAFGRAYRRTSWKARSFPENGLAL